MIFMRPIPALSRVVPTLPYDVNNINRERYNTCVVESSWCAFQKVKIVKFILYVLDATIKFTRIYTFPPMKMRPL